VFESKINLGYIIIYATNPRHPSLAFVNVVGFQNDPVIVHRLVIRPVVAMERTLQRLGLQVGLQLPRLGLNTQLNFSSKNQASSPVYVNALYQSLCEFFPFCTCTIQEPRIPALFSDSVARAQSLEFVLQPVSETAENQLSAICPHPETT
jgi:hypothetical protein